MERETKTEQIQGARRLATGHGRLELGTYNQHIPTPDLKIMRVLNPSFFH